MDHAAERVRPLRSWAVRTQHVSGERTPSHCRTERADRKVRGDNWSHGAIPLAAFIHATDIIRSFKKALAIGTVFGPNGRMADRAFRRSALDCNVHSHLLWRVTAPG
jgi:hypothetical protein